MGEPRDLLDPAVVAQVDKLELLARELVEGFLHGLHLGASKGTSTEFVEHRPYAPGDDVRRMDWRTYGKTDRYYLKQYEEETNLRALLVVDASASMGFRSGPMTKFRYASALAASLGYLLLRQRDSVGLCLVDSRLRRFVPPRGTAEHLNGIFDELDRAETRGRTALGHVLHRIAERMAEGSLVLIFSDLLDEPSDIVSGLSHLRQRRGEAIVFQVADPAEEELPFTGWVIFEDMEEPSTRLRLDTREVREEYLRNLRSHREALRKGCSAAEVDYVLSRTDEPFEVQLARFLNVRARYR